MNFQLHSFPKFPISILTFTCCTLTAQGVSPFTFQTQHLSDRPCPRQHTMPQIPPLLSNVGWDHIRAPGLHTAHFLDELKCLLWIRGGETNNDTCKFSIWQIWKSKLYWFISFITCIVMNQWPSCPNQRFQEIIWAFCEEIVVTPCWCNFVRSSFNREWQYH